MKKSLQIISLFISVIMYFLAIVPSFAAEAAADANLYLNHMTDPAGAERVTSAGFGEAVTSGKGDFTKIPIETATPRVAMNINGKNNTYRDHVEGRNFMVIQTDFAADENVRNIFLATDSNARVGNMIPSSKWEARRWHNLKMVCTVDHTKSNATDGIYLSKIETYIDGEKVDTSENASKPFVNTGSKAKAVIRLVFTKTADGSATMQSGENVETTFYMSRIWNYTTNTYPVIPASADIKLKGEAVSGNRINYTEGLSVSDITTETGSAVRVYSDKSYTQLLDESDVLPCGAVAVVDKQAETHVTYGPYFSYRKYYNVELQGRYMCEIDSDGSSFGNGSLSYGTFGKGTDDAINFFDTEDVSAEIKTSSLNDVDSEFAYKYLVLEASFAPKGLISEITFNKVAESSLSDGWVYGRWNRIRYIYEIDEEKLYGYVNGKKLLEVNCSDLTSTEKISLSFNISGELSLDDYSAYYVTENYLPHSMKICTPTADSMHANIVFIDNDKNVESISYQDAALTIWEDNTFGEVVTAATLENGNVLVFVTEDKIYNYYNVVERGKTEEDATGEGIDFAAQFAPQTKTLSLSGELAEPKKETVNFIAKSRTNSDRVINLNFMSDNDGIINYSCILADKYIGHRYTYTASGLNATVENDIIVANLEKAHQIINLINGKTSAEETQSVITSSLMKESGFEDGNAAKDFEYMSKLIFAMRPLNGYDYDSFLDAYMLSEGLSYVKTGALTFEQMLKKYALYTGSDYNTAYKALSAAKREEMEKIYRYGVVYESFAKSFSNSSYVSDYRLVRSALSLKTKFLNYAASNNVDMSEFNKITNEVDAEKVFDSMYLDRSACYHAEDTINHFNKYVKDNQPVSTNNVNNNFQESVSSGGGGGGGGSMFVDVILPQEENIPTTDLFSDIADHWAKNDIKELAELKIINGYKDNTYRPENNVTRAEFSKMITAMLGLESVKADAFSDVSETSWFAPYIGAAYSSGLINGYNGMFNPDANISRQDAAVIIYRALESRNISVPAGEYIYSDASADYAEAKIASLSSMGIIKGINGAFMAEKNLTRAEAATILNRITDIVMNVGE